MAIQTGYFSLQLSEIENRKKIVAQDAEVRIKEEKLAGLTRDIESARRLAADLQSSVVQERARAQSWSAAAKAASGAAATSQRLASSKAAEAASATIAATTAIDALRRASEHFYETETYPDVLKNVRAQVDGQCLVHIVATNDLDLKRLVAATAGSIHKARIFFGICIRSVWPYSGTGRLNSADSKALVRSTEELADRLNDVFGHVIDLAIAGKGKVPTEEDAHSIAPDMMWRHYTQLFRSKYGQNGASAGSTDDFEEDRLSALRSEFGAYASRYIWAFPAKPSEVDEAPKRESKLK